VLATVLMLVISAARLVALRSVAMDYLDVERSRTERPE